jgi:hypothetical protein
MHLLIRRPPYKSSFRLALRSFSFREREREPSSLPTWTVDTPKEEMQHTPFTAQMHALEDKPDQWVQLTKPYLKISVRYKRPRQAHSAVRDCCLGHFARYAALVLTPPLKRPRNTTKQWKKKERKMEGRSPCWCWCCFPQLNG